MDTTIPKEPLKEFCLLELISHGTFGCCFKAAYNGRTFAIKILEDIERYELIGFVREAAEADLNSKDIDFASYRKRWEIDAISAVCYLHTKNYVHRNICFAKFLIWDNTTRLKLSLSLHSIRTSLEDLNSQMFPRICCLAPECITENRYSKASDVFALVAFLIMLKTRDWENSKNSKYDGDFIHSLLLKSANEYGTRLFILLKNALHPNPRHRPSVFEIAGQLYNDIPDLSSEELINNLLPVPRGAVVDQIGSRKQTLQSAPSDKQGTPSNSQILDESEVDDFQVPVFKRGENISILNYVSRGGEGTVYTTQTADKGSVWRGKHPNILEIFGTYEGFNPHVPQKIDRGYVMEFMTGGSLEEAIYSNKPYEPEKAYHWMYQISHAVIYMHLKKVVHLDLKPLNMLLDVTGTRLKIGDFGLSKNLKFSKLTAKRATYAYMAPELFDEKIQLQKLNLYEADVYSLGVTFWELLYRKPPFDGLSQAQICQKVVAGKRPSMENFIWEKEIRELIEKSWMDLPYERCALPNYIYTLNTVLQEPTDFRDLLPVSRRGVVDLLIKQEEWPLLKEFISDESQEVQQAFKVFMKIVDKSGAIIDGEDNDLLPVPRKRQKKSGDHASIRLPQLPSEETSSVELLQLKVVNETNDAQKENTKDDSKFTISEITDLHVAVRQGDEKLAQSLIDKGVDVNGKEGEYNYSPLHVATQNGRINMIKLLLYNGAIVDSEDKHSATPLHFAARHRDNLMVEMFITAGASVSSEDKDGLTPLQFAVGHNHIESARTLLKHRAPIDGATVDGSTPLHFAAQNGRVEMVKLLLQHRATIDSRDNDLCTPLHLAAQYGQDQVVEMLLDAGASVCSQDKDGWTPLHFAAGDNYIKSARTLLEHCASIDAVTVIGCTSLHIAAQNDCVEMVKLLLQHGATIDSRREDLYTALHLAAEGGHDQVADVLLAAGASVSSKGKYGLTPLHFAAQNGRVDMVKVLLQHGAIVDSENNDQATSLHLAAQEGHGRVVDVLLGAGASVTPKAIDGWTPLHSAAKNNHTESARTLFKHRALIDAATVIGSTPLHCAAQKGHVDMVMLLLQHGAIVDSEDNDHYTPLHLAAFHGHHLVVKMLITGGASVTSKDKDGWTPLHCAAQNGRVEMVKLLLQHGAIVDSRDNDLCTPLCIAAVHGHHLVMKMLITAGASVSSEDKDGLTPLHFAVANNHIESARTLLKHRAPINGATVDGSTPLHFAAEGGNEFMVKLLLDENADLNACNSNGRTPLHIACIKSMIKVVILLLQYKVTIEVTDKDGLSPLQLACCKGAIDCVTYLLERGANPNTTANDGLTALYNATLANYADVVKILIQYGANVDARCIFLQSALHIASLKGNVDIVTFLLQAGANPNNATKDNKTPLQLARANGHNEIAAILVKYGAR